MNISFLQNQCELIFIFMQYIIFHTNEGVRRTRGLSHIFKRNYLWFLTKKRIQCILKDIVQFNKGANCMGLVVTSMTLTFIVKVPIILS